MYLTCMLFGCCALANGSANAVKGGTGMRGQSVSEVGACTREERELAVQQVLPLYHRHRPTVAPKEKRHFGWCPSPKGTLFVECQHVRARLTV